MLTPVVWKKLVEPLEKFGWIIGSILAGIEIVSWVVGEVRFEYRLLIGIVAIVVLGLTALSVKYDLHGLHASRTTPTIADSPSFHPNLDPRYYHLEARLFYGPGVRWGKRERDPHKNNPQHKLLLEVKTNKAYFMRDDMWNLVLENKN